MFRTQNMTKVTSTLVLVTIVLFTGISLTNPAKEPVAMAQSYSDDENGSTGSNSLAQNSTTNAIEVTIVQGAATLGNKAFSPDSTNIKLGDNVTWANSDSQFHTVTSGTGPDDPNVANEFDSKALSPDEKFSHIFDNGSLIGTELTYFCQIHPTMVGEITIDQA